ncbi:MAG: glycosyltransferase [Oceanospirillaceae bacterium]|nr:glycosyltransferase [Oceanospirillaceae bacterium]
MKVANVVLNNFKNDSRVLKISKSLFDLGITPTVVAIHDDGLLEEECVQGIAVNRLRLKSRSLPKWRPVQVVKYVEFVLRAFLRYRKANIVHCNDLSALPVGLLIKLFGKNVKVVYDCHEYETEVNGIGGFEKLFRRILEKFQIRYADTILTVSDSIANEYVRLYGVKKPDLVLNCPLYQSPEKSELFREKLGIRKDQNIFLYQGALFKGRGIEMLLDVFGSFKSDKNVLVCMGYGSLEGLIREAGLQHNRVFFHPAVNQEVLLNYTSSADFGISFIEDSCLSYRYCLPNKMFEYFMAGIPVITSNLFEMKKLVEKEGVGVVASNNSKDGFQDALENILAMDYARLQRNVISLSSLYCWEEQEKSLKAAYESIL